MKYKLWLHDIHLCTVRILKNSTAQICINILHQGRIQDLIRGGPDRDRPLLMMRSSVVRGKRALFSMGLGPTLGPWKLLGISLLNMHSLHFGVPFYTIFEIIKYQYFLINCPDKLFCTQVYKFLIKWTCICF